MSIFSIVSSGGVHWVGAKTDTRVRTHNEGNVDGGDYRGVGVVPL